MAQVILQNVNKIYDKAVHVVKDVNLIVKDKEFMVLVGPSGCGKSTTLRMIAGLEEITSGEIIIGDRIVNDVPPKDRDIAMVFQNYALYPHMSVYDNLAFGLKLRKFSKDKIKKRVDEAAEILGLTDYLGRKPAALSGGQRQRVAVGRAIVRHPKVFLFDEPLSNLDAKLRVQMRSELSRLHQNLEATMIYVTHDQTEAMTMGSRITVMRDGIIQQVDTPLNLYDNPVNLFVAGFIGSPSMNILPGKIEQTAGVRFVSEGINIPVPSIYLPYLEKYIGFPIYLGVRPENITVAKDSSISAVTEVVEPMGNEVFIHTKIGKSKLLLRVLSRILPRPGETIALDFLSDHLHFFDPSTEQSLTFTK